MKLTVLSISQDISFSKGSDDNDIDPFFGSSTIFHPSTTRHASLQETDAGATTTGNDDLHHSSVLREVENFLDVQPRIHFTDASLVWWR
jgi:hypothetical protein